MSGAALPTAPNDPDWELGFLTPLAEPRRRAPWEVFLPRRVVENLKSYRRAAQRSFRTAETAKSFSGNEPLRQALRDIERVGARSLGSWETKRLARVGRALVVLERRLRRPGSTAKASRDFVRACLREFEASVRAASARPSGRPAEGTVDAQFYRAVRGAFESSHRELRALEARRVRTTARAIERLKVTFATELRARSKPWAREILGGGRAGRAQLAEHVAEVADRATPFLYRLLRANGFEIVATYEDGLTESVRLRSCGPADLALNLVAAWSGLTPAAARRRLVDVGSSSQKRGASLTAPKRRRSHAASHDEANTLDTTPTTPRRRTPDRGPCGPDGPLRDTPFRDRARTGSPTTPA